MPGSSDIGPVLPQMAVNVKAARRGAGLTQHGLAVALELRSVRTVQSWERSERMPRVRHLQALALLTGYDVAWFYAEHDAGDESVAA